MTLYRLNNWRLFIEENIHDALRKRKKYFWTGYFSPRLKKRLTAYHEQQQTDYPPIQ